jgi:hypothetical protein
VTSAINRYYDPATGQFISVDPDVAVTDQPYAYAGDDPVDDADVLGLFPGEGFLKGLGQAFVGQIGAALHAGAIAYNAANQWTATETCQVLNPQPGSLVFTLAGCGQQGNSGTATSASCPNSTSPWVVTGGVYPNFGDPSESPGPGWEWRGSGPEGSSRGSWYNPLTDQSLHPDLDHPGPIGPHYDYSGPDTGGKSVRIYPGEEIPDVRPFPEIQPPEGIPFEG